MAYRTFSATAIKHCSLFALIFIAFIMTLPFCVAGEYSIASQTVNSDQKQRNETPSSYSYFDKAPQSVLALAKKLSANRILPLQR